MAKIELRIHFNSQSESSLKRIIPEPSFPSRGSQARGTRLLRTAVLSTLIMYFLQSETNASWKRLCIIIHIYNKPYISLWPIRSQFDMDLARAPRRARLTARKKGSGYENAVTCSFSPQSPIRLTRKYRNAPSCIA